VRYGHLYFDGFEWDAGNTPKVKERVPLAEVEALFKKRVLIREDTRHSYDEERLIAMGETSDNRCLLVAFTIRKRERETLVRVISARFTHKKEGEAYEEVKKKLLEK
jgi:uncharacterized DUF497 family protein